MRNVEDCIIAMGKKTDLVGALKFSDFTNEYGVSHTGDPIELATEFAFWWAHVKEGGEILVDKASFHCSSNCTGHATIVFAKNREHTRVFIDDGMSAETFESILESIETDKVDLLQMCGGGKMQ